jgi:hypothetical protein
MILAQSFGLCLLEGKPGLDFTVKKRRKEKERLARCSSSTPNLLARLPSKLCAFFFGAHRGAENYFSAADWEKRWQGTAVRKLGH